MCRCLGRIIMRRVRPHRIQRKNHRIKISKSHRLTDINHHSGSKRISTTMIQVRWVTFSIQINTSKDHRNLTNNRIWITRIEERQISRITTEYQSLTTPSIKEEKHQHRLSTAIKETLDIQKGLINYKIRSKSLKLISTRKQPASQITVNLVQTACQRLDSKRTRISLLHRLARIRIWIRLWQQRRMSRLGTSYGYRRICRVISIWTTIF